MQIPQIRIQSQDAQIQIKMKDASVEIEQPQAELTIRQPQAELTIQTKPGKLTIDQSQAWAEANLKHIFELNREFAEKGMSAALEGTGRRAREGSELMQIENGGNPLVSQAVNKAYPGMKPLGIDFIPSHFSVKIDYEPAEVQINVQTNQPSIEAKPNKPIFRYHKGDVDISLIQKPEIDISFVNITI